MIASTRSMQSSTATLSEFGDDSSAASRDHVSGSMAVAPLRSPLSVSANVSYTSARSDRSAYSAWNNGSDISTTKGSDEPSESADGSKWPSALRTAPPVRRDVSPTIRVS